MRYHRCVRDSGSDCEARGSSRLILDSFFYEKFFDLFVCWGIGDEIFYFFAIVNSIKITKLLTKKFCIKVSSKYFTGFHADFMYSMVLAKYKVEIDIVFPLCSTTESICLHGTKSEEIWNFYDSLKIHLSHNIKWKREKCTFHTSNYPCHIVFITHMQCIPFLF